MRKTHLIVLVVGTMLLKACTTANQETRDPEASTSADPYLGQIPPGLAAKPWAPDSLPTDGWELGTRFNPDMNEYYLTTTREAPYGPTVIVFRREDGNWKQYDFYATYGNDGNRLYWKNKYIEQTDSGWSQIKTLGAMFEREDWGIMRLSASLKGTYVFDDWKSNDVIRISRIKDGKREAPQLLGEEINTGKWTAHPFIAPDESYLIWDSERAGGFGDSDLYVSFRQEDGSWGTAINLGDDVNTPLQENSSRVTPDGKYLFFWRAEEKVREDGSTYWEAEKYWVSTQVFEQHRPKP